MENNLPCTLIGSLNLRVRVEIDGVVLRVLNFALVDIPPDN